MQSLSLPKFTPESSTKQEILGILLKQARANALTLANRLAISPQAVRRHLKDLLTEGLIELEGTELAKDLGRPQHFYQLTQLGRDRLPKSYDRFAVDLLSSLLKNLTNDQAAQVLGSQWHSKGLQYRQAIGQGSLPDRLELLAELRRSEGYVTEWNLWNEGYIFTEYNCAIAQIAASHPRICTHELEMFSTALPDCAVKRTHWLIEGEHRCGYLIRQGEA
ncbi:MAG: iron-sulfur cluster biosynthesis transcriptional regulator SufR [Pseudanabaenaceae cyanobacterium bins.68]|nr:iron-sulfur cluster biosynthesis transcriptional regulator SufR [Pseudanabaenaceae cyanobacterium bins.68]